MNSIKNFFYPWISVIQTPRQPNPDEQKLLQTLTQIQEECILLQNSNYKDIYDWAEAIISVANKIISVNPINDSETRIDRDLRMLSKINGENQNELITRLSQYNADICKLKTCISQNIDWIQMHSEGDFIQLADKLWGIHIDLSKCQVQLYDR